MFRRFVDGVGNARDFLLLQGLRDVDELGGIAFLHGIVEVAHGAYFQDALPAVVLLEYLEHHVLLDHRAQLAGVASCGNAQQHPVVVFLQSEEIQLRGVGEQCAVVVIIVAAQFVVA